MKLLSSFMIAAFAALAEPVRAQDFAAEISAVQAACPPSKFTGLVDLVLCEDSGARTVWARYFPNSLDLFDAATVQRLHAARDFDTKAVTSDFAVRRFQDITLDLVEAVKRRQVATAAAPSPQTPAPAPKGNGVRSVLADALRSYAIAKGATPDGRPPITTTCQTLLGVTTCTTR